uniref:Ras- protein Rab-22A n=1 Tax=Sphaerodactylus townsendi TaxID=933632 RepID=A0ACB8F677_9SAUR
MYYRGSSAAIIVYDITKEETFSTLKNWVKELRQHGPPNIVVAIAGNKCDLNDAREVMEKDAKDYADSIHAIFVETSAKNAININELFIEISSGQPLKRLVSFPDESPKNSLESSRISKVVEFHPRTPTLQLAVRASNLEDSLQRPNAAAVD